MADGGDLTDPETDTDDDTRESNGQKREGKEQTTRIEKKRRNAARKNAGNSATVKGVCKTAGKKI